MLCFEVKEVFTLAALRKNHPSWTWTAERQGFGWAYRGTRGEEEVTVQRVAAAFDDTGEEPSEYRVYGAGRGVRYFEWRDQ